MRSIGSTLPRRRSPPPRIGWAPTGWVGTFSSKSFWEYASHGRSVWLLRRQFVPNLIGPVVVYATLTIPQMILFESFLSFLGLGVQEPLASLGSLINDGAQEMQSAPWMLLVPAGFLVVLLMCFNLVGDAL